MDRRALGFSALEPQTRRRQRPPACNRKRERANSHSDHGRDRKRAEPPAKRQIGAIGTTIESGNKFAPPSDLGQRASLSLYLSDGHSGGKFMTRAGRLWRRQRRPKPAAGKNSMGGRR